MADPGNHSESLCLMSMPVRRARKKHDQVSLQEVEDIGEEDMCGYN